MIKYVQGDLFDYIKEFSDDPTITFIPHIVNTYGYWASGFVVAVEKFCPLAKQNYESLFIDHAFERGMPNETLLGNNQLVLVERNQCIVNMFAQLFGGNRPLRYDALAKCMATLGDRANEAVKDGHQVRIVAPKFGSLRAGGDWDFVEKLVEDCWISRGLDTTIIEYPHKQIVSRCQQCNQKAMPLFLMPNRQYFCRGCYSQR
ncbi:hypothetical protein KDA08_06055 [Candidatus Saccharibacteria bacterium]|nr:hypothetical protein [Candidatus Saccharibacteria bacterium]